MLQAPAAGEGLGPMQGNWPREGAPAIVVTGASFGIGRELALVAAREGLPLLLVARSATALASLVEELAAQGATAHALPLDLAAPEAAIRVGEALHERGLTCEMLVNNAGFGLTGLAHALDAGEQAGMVALNVQALTTLTLAALPAMVARRRGGVLLVGSVAGFIPGPGMAVYYASKAFVRSFADALWSELHNRGVAITNLAPGPVDTGFLDRAGIGRHSRFRLLPQATARQVAEQGWRGFRQSKRLVVPGMGNRALVTLAPLLPTRLVLAGVKALQLRRRRVKP